jgi:putative SOS response-associated peptidase YedK
MYQLTRPVVLPKMQPGFNVCPTHPADTIVEHEGQRQLEAMRWGSCPFGGTSP